MVLGFYQENIGGSVCLTPPIRRDFVEGDERQKTSTGRGKEETIANMGRGDGKVDNRSYLFYAPHEIANTPDRLVVQRKHLLDNDA